MFSWKKGFFALLLILIITLLSGTYLMIDQGVSYGYLKDSYDYQQKEMRIYRRVIVLGGEEFTKKDLLHTLRVEYPDAFIVEDEEKIRIDGATFCFREDKLADC